MIISNFMKTVGFIQFHIATFGIFEDEFTEIELREGRQESAAIFKDGGR